MNSDEMIDFFEKSALLTAREVNARRSILLDYYSKGIAIEGWTALKMGRIIILPAVIKYQKELAKALKNLKEFIPENELKGKIAILNKININCENLIAALDVLEKELVNLSASNLADLDKAKLYRDVIFKLAKECRNFVDQLEESVDDSIWPLPKYSKMLAGIGDD